MAPNRLFGHRVMAQDSAITVSRPPCQINNWLTSLGDYVFGWKDDALQKAMDSNCNINCPALKTQTITKGNQCAVKRRVTEDIDSCEFLENTF